MYLDNCVSCDTVTGKYAAPGGVIYENEHWLVVSRSRPMVLGYLFILLKRHCEHLAEITSEESATLGPTIQRTCFVLSQVLEPEKIYVASWGEGVKHIHFHVLPRMRGMPVGNRLMKIYLRLKTLLYQLGMRNVAYSNKEVADVAERLRREFVSVSIY